MITPTKLRTYFALVKDVRQLQDAYRRTQDPMLRTKLPALQDQLDRDTERLNDELGTGDPDTAELYAIVEDLATVPTDAAFCAAQLVPLIARARDLLRSTAVTRLAPPAADVVRADAGHAPPAPKSMEGGGA